MIRMCSMATDIVEYQEKYVLTCNVPGVAKENIEIEMDDDRLVISVQYPQLSTDEKMRIHLQERDAGNKLIRKYSIPDVDATKITATLNDGVLTIALPKMQHQKPANIKIM